MFSLPDINIMILGGDKREIELLRILKETGANVKIWGFDNFPDSNSPVVEALVDTSDIAGELQNAHVLIAPLPGINAKGQVPAPYARHQIRLDDLTASLPEGLLLLSGKVDPTLKEKLANIIDVIETTGLEELKIMNAVPTAEGAIEHAMKHTKITIFESESFVLGFGRCGFALTRSLLGLGAKVNVCARRFISQAEAKTIGAAALSFDELQKRISKADIIFNTVPATVLPATVLAKLQKSCIIIDIAASPGGTDFHTAQNLGLQAFLLPALPGKVAPQSAGKILGEIYPRLIINYFEQRREKNNGV